jgi:hypothetical protein
MSNQEQFDDILAARNEVRRLRKAAAEARAVWTERKTELSAASAMVEGLLDEMEAHQGRLPFEPAPEPIQPKRRPKTRDTGTSAAMKNVR